MHTILKGVYFMFKYLYIAQEYDRRPRLESETEYNPWVKWIISPSQFCKIGITSQDIPAERLRKLLVGNPRPIELSHMWIGKNYNIKWIEQYVLAHYGDERIREWIPASAEDIVEQVNVAIAARGYTEIFTVPDKYLPYTATSYGECVFKQQKKDTTAIFFEAKELASKI
jgi:hypothetical protein